MLFPIRLLSKMRLAADSGGGSCFGIVLNGSPQLTGRGRQW